MYFTKMDTKFCELILVGDEDGLSQLNINTGEGTRAFEIEADWILNPDFFEDTIRQLLAYEQGNLKVFDVKLNPVGTAFQKSVWQALTEIPYGETVSYKTIAEKLGKPNGSRAVGTANSKNPIPIIVPCHRVVGSNNKMTGFAFGIPAKAHLIEHEKMYR